MIRALAIACPTATRNDYPGIDAGYFDGEGYFLLYCQPNGWQPEDEYLGEDGYEVTFRRLRLKRTIDTVIRGYRISTPESRAAFFYLTERLAQTRPILVKDYLRPEDSDYRAALLAENNPFTLRQGILSEVKPNRALVGSIENGFRFPEGFSFKFTEGSTR